MGRAFSHCPALVLALVISLIASGPAWSKNPTLTTEARRLFLQSQTLYEKDRFEEALALLRAAYAITPSSLLMYNIGLCQERLGLAEEAVESFKVYLAGQPEAPDRAEVEGWIQRLEGSIAATIRIATAPLKATALLDGRQECQTPCSYQVLPGKHSVEVRLAGYQKHTWVVEAARQSQHELSAILAPIPPPQPPPQPSQLQLSVQPQGAIILVDGSSPGRAPLEAPLSLLPGKHRIRVEGEGYLPWEREVVLEASHRLDLTIELTASGPSKSALQIAGWSTAALAVTATTLGAILGGLQLSTRADLEGRAFEGQPWGEDDEELMSLNQNYKASSIALVSLAVASAIASSVLLALGYTSPDSPSAPLSWR